MNVQNQIRRDLKDAFDVWEYNTVLKFSEVHSNSDILIQFFKKDHGDRMPFHTVETLAHAFHPENGNIHFNDDVSWHFGKDYDRNDDSKIFGASFFDSAVHEIGHVLGLTHSAVQKSIMWLDIKYDYRYWELNDDDLERIHLLYGWFNLF